jgi:hypothetical protein
VTFIRAGFGASGFVVEITAGSGMGPSFIGIERASRPAPPATAARSRVTAVSLNLWKSRLRRTSAASAAAAAETPPPAA